MKTQTGILDIPLPIFFDADILIRLGDCLEHHDGIFSKRHSFPRNGQSRPQHQGEKIKAAYRRKAVRLDVDTYRPGKAHLESLENHCCIKEFFVGGISVNHVRHVFYCSVIEGGTIIYELLILLYLT